MFSAIAASSAGVAGVIFLPARRTESAPDLILDVAGQLAGEARGMPAGDFEHLPGRGARAVDQRGSTNRCAHVLT